MITATKNGITRNFSETQWSNMPTGKYGWVIGSASEQPQTNIPDISILQKKMVAGEVVDAVNPVPDEIIKPKLKDIPEEIKNKPGRPKK
jgi:hypothetical protein